ncbi:alpha/beta hydrolase [Pontibacter diazotrophicus]|uniref:Alpha/beta hydrolase n=1 Tax=Pontibacter diazotrophicus TaxID=1400979 RepID=A0A3D8L7K2_9BACT|nr:alpha/beta hydrolase [Pontibacter diazotrophicus]RDV13389.1 alpha/beta hydrolase [Pontibacter diazotrophicus]
MGTIYLISGLGADWRMFRSLKLPEQYRKQHVDWIPPKHVKESLPDYVQRLKQEITDPDPILIGLSYGGVIAIELAKVLQPRKTIIISSLATRHALPWYYRALGKTKLHHWVPLKVLQSALPFAPWLFGAHSRHNKKLLREVILDIDELFLRWSLGQLLDWQQEEVLPGLVHIHGTADRVLPLYNRPGLTQVPGGEHLMVLHQPDEISAILKKILENE